MPRSYIGSERKTESEATAAEIMATGVKYKDVCHLASAIYAQCEYFISTDIRLLKRKTSKIKLVTPTQFVTETEAE